MAEVMPATTHGQLARVSALSGAYRAGRYGTESIAGPGVEFTELGLSRLTQFSAWTDTRNELLAAVCRCADAYKPPQSGGSVRGTRGSVLQVEPLKWWLLEAAPVELEGHLGVALDLSHARTRLRVEGRCAAELLNRHLALDLRDAVANAGQVQLCNLHQAPLAIWHTAGGFELFISRAYAESVFALLRKSAAQFGYEIKPFAPA